MAADAIILALATLLTAAGGVVGALTLGAKQLAEARAARTAAEHTARQVSPNHGSSLADSLSRVEQEVAHLHTSLGGLRDDARADREALTSHQRSTDTTLGIIASRLDSIERNRT